MPNGKCLEQSQGVRAISDKENVQDLKDYQAISKRISTSFNALRIRNTRSRYLPAERHDLRSCSQSNSDDTLAEEHELFFRLPFVRYGFYMSQQTRFGPIFPALRVYNIVEDLDEFENLRTLRCGSTVDFQKAIASGIIHPFTRDRRHRSLLHVGL